ncbi:MAG: prepilin peptidase [Candidatus Pacebacteria bacterium]|jgi:leader peptidase (prepilin peptidase) / N-methyltransferase|nr:prepilin peptidase [Candidatus Paceibacterota bacterium]MBT3511933.1 prepilin peptidase [Candidatus Paceibacterota bacterium]MBT4005255.1 prepilin peptidase [Candidatus Paceibacterota bacterium]MBT4358975.1 prepilin peptidase [Candidatus Paceibacterota bacterium]MBT4680460.1 prepilin peptidase [Candidatus Paceibacterota bacterium]
MGSLVFFSFFLFILGSAVGSFLNVLIYRTVRGESWVSGRSHCDHCQKKIAWYDNMPILSFLLLGGKSRCCKKRIPISYPFVEFVTGSLFVWWYGIGFVFFRLTTAPFQVLQPLFWLLVGILLLTIFFADLMHMIIPDLAVGALFLLTLFYRIYLTSASIMQPQDLYLALVGMLIAVAFIGGLWALTKGKGMGFGDVKLMAPIALLLGWPKILVGLFFSFIIGGISGVILLILGKKRVGQVIPFGPFIILGAVVSLFWGDAIFSWYMHWL